MSILNITNDGLYNILIILYKCLLINKKLKRDELLNQIAPISLTDQEMAKKTLNRWIELGLFEENEMISISLDYQSPKKTDIQSSVNNLPSILRTIIFKKKNNLKFWEARENKCADFTRALSWILCQDVYSFNTQSYNDISQIESDQFVNASERRPFQNDTRWNGFKSWAGYLGFTFNSNSLQIDPTKAVLESLQNVFRKDKELSQVEFFDRLKKMLPVIDNGEYRVLVEKELAETHWHKISDYQISTSLSRALMRLEMNKIIKLTLQSDAEKDVVWLLGVNNQPLSNRKYSHISLERGIG